MSDQTLNQKLDALDAGADFSDPNFYADLLGYNSPEQPAEPTPAPQGETAAEPAPAEPAAAESNPTPAVAEPKDSEIAGVLTKDGKHVMPFSVVKDLRTTTQEQAQRIAELQAANERLEAEARARADGTSTASSQAQAEVDALAFSEEELADLEAIPVAQKLVKGFQALQERLAQIQSAPAQEPQQPARPDPAPVQAVIDTMPLLVKWQAKGGELWQQAVELDKQLRDDPQWAGKPMPERFAEVQRRVAEDYGIPTPSAPRAAPAAAPKPGPTAQPETREVMPTLSDFSGGQVAIGDPMAGMTPGQMVDKAMGMSVEEIRRMAGLSY